LLILWEILTINAEKENLYLVLDQGGHATRAIIFDERSQIRCHFESPISTRQQGELIVEHDPIELIASFADVINQTYQFLKEKFKNIKTAGLATQRSSFVCWNKNTGKAYTPVISWQDRRSVDDNSRFDQYQNMIHEKTGLFLNPHYGASKMFWCLQNVPSLQKAIEKNELCIAPLSSFVLFHLLKQKPFKVDPANASRTLLMDYQRLQWDQALCEIFKIPQHCLPKIHHTAHEYGNLEAHGHEIPLKICTGDQSAAVFSAGKPDSEKIYLNIGTGAFIQHCSEDLPDVSNEKLLASVVYTDSEKNIYALEGTVNGAGRALQWYAKKTSCNDYEENLDNWSREYTEPPLFINGISGVGSPFWNATLSSEFVGDVKNTQAGFVAVLESIAFLITCNIHLMLKISPCIKSITISGGVSASNSLCQKISDLSKLPVTRAKAAEATAKGANYLLSNNSLSLSKEATDDFSAIKNPSFDARYYRWLKLMNEA